MDCKHNLTFHEYIKGVLFRSTKCKKCGKRIRIKPTKYFPYVITVLLSVVSIELIYKFFKTSIVSDPLAVVIPFCLFFVYCLVSYKYGWYRIETDEERHLDADLSENLKQ